MYQAQADFSCGTLVCDPDFGFLFFYQITYFLILAMLSAAFITAYIKRSYWVLGFLIGTFLLIALRWDFNFRYLKRQHASSTECAEDFPERL